MKINNFPTKEIISFFSTMSSKVIPNDRMFIDSLRVYQKYCALNLNTYKVLCTKKQFREAESLLKEIDDIYIIETSDFKKINGYSFNSGFIAYVEKPKIKDLSELKGPAVLLNGLTSPENVGAIIRTATGLGFNNVIVDTKTVSPLSRRAIRVSMGNVFHTNLYLFKFEEHQSFISERFRLIACHNTDNAQPISSFDFRNKDILIIGSEGHGIDKNIIEISNHSIKIPVQANVEHYNASHACAIILYKMYEYISS